MDAQDRVRLNYPLIRRTINPNDGGGQLEKTGYSLAHGLNIDNFVGMPAQVPAGAAAEVRKQGMDAGVGLLLAGLVLNLPTLDVDGVKRIHRYFPKLRTPARNLEAQRAIVADIQQSGDNDNRSDYRKQRTFHGWSRVAAPR